MIRRDLNMADSHIKSKIKKYTIEEDELIKKYYPLGSWDEVLKHLPNRNKDSIQQRAKKLKVSFKSYDKYFFDEIDSEEKAYWLGFIYADGYTTDDGRFGIELASVDKEHIQKLLNSMKSNLKIKDRIRIKGDIEYKSSSILINNKHLNSSLISKGVVPRKTEILCFPEEKVLPKNLRNHFIRGYFDGDGTIIKKDYERMREDRNNKIYQRTMSEVSVVCKSYRFIESLCTLLNDELNLNVEIKINKNLNYIRYHSKENIIKILNYLYKDSNVYLERKYNKSLELLKYCLA